MSTRLSSAEVTLPSDCEILIIRRFDAPAERVWRAITEPRHLLRWWGPTWCPMVDCVVDLRVGGAWRYVCRAADGNELGWHGEYRAIDPTERIVTTEVFEGFPDAASLNSMTLTEVDGVTTLSTVVLHSSKEHRDGHIASGMEGGMQETFDRLEHLLAALDESSAAERFRRVARRFSARVDGVRDDQWDFATPCEGWVARDVIDHLVSWVPAVLAPSGVAFDGGASVRDDPAAAWHHLEGALEAALADPAMAAHEFDAGPPGRMTVEAAIDMMVTGDLVIHTWDLARATGQDDTLDPIEVPRMLAGMQPIEEILRASGHFGSRVEVPDDADDQTKLIAFCGRTP